MVAFAVLSRTNLADPSRHSSLNSRPFNLLQPLMQLQKSQLLCNQANPASFCKTPGWGYPSTSASGFTSAVICITCRLYPLRSQSIAHTSRHHRGVYESVWQLCCLGEFLVISMIHLHSSEVVARCGLDFLCAGYFQRGLSRHMRVRFNALVANANSAATFPSPRMRNRRMPRCSFKIPMTGSASAFRRRYNARPAVEANLLRMRRRAV